MTDCRSDDERLLYGLVIAIGAIPVVLAAVERLDFAWQPTCVLLMMCACLVGLFARAER